MVGAGRLRAFVVMLDYSGDVRCTKVMYGVCQDNVNRKYHITFMHIGTI